MKRVQTTYFSPLDYRIPNCGSTAYQFEYPIRNPGDQLEKLYPYRRWNIMAYTISIMQVAPGLNNRRPIKKNIGVRIWQSIPVSKLFNQVLQRRKA